MNEEEIKAAEAAEAEAKASATKEGSGESQNDTEEIAKALEAERQARYRAEADLEETRKKARERIKAKEAGESPEGDKPLTKAGLQAILEEEREMTRKIMQESTALTVARGLAESDSEANLTVEIWRNRKLSGNLEEQIREAHAISTYKRKHAESEELKRALASKEGVNRDGSNAKRNPAPANEPRLNDVDKSVVSGMTWDAARGAYRKLIAGGTKIFFVSRDLKKRWTEKAEK